jgi:FkbM family methyltransferase
MAKIMMNDYAQLMCMREELVDGIGPWVWQASDRETFKGISRDWEDSHKAKYLEHITDWNICIQAGGCMGMYPRLLSEMFNLVYTFEPDPLNFFALAANCQKDNIIKMQVALGHEHKPITVNRPFDGNQGMNTINETESIIPMITIDSLNLPDCNFMQLDVEYYELNVLRGALKTIEKFKPVISCELGFIHWFDQQKQEGLAHNGSILSDNTLGGDILALLEPFGYQKVDQSAADTIYKVV